MGLAGFLRSLARGRVARCEEEQQQLNSSSSSSSSSGGGNSSSAAGAACLERKFCGQRGGLCLVDQDVGRVLFLYPEILSGSRMLAKPPDDVVTCVGCSIFLPSSSRCLAFAVAHGTEA